MQLPRLLMHGAATISLLCAAAMGQNAGPSSVSPDNSKKNASDQPTAQDQGNSPQDREMTRNIRRELVKEDSLTSTAKNIKVITENGKVILRGPVSSQDERKKIEALAEQVAGKGNVTNQLEPKER